MSILIIFVIGALIGFGMGALGEFVRNYDRPVWSRRSLRRAIRKANR